MDIVRYFINKFVVLFFSVLTLTVYSVVTYGSGCTSGETGVFISFVNSSGDYAFINPKSSISFGDDPMNGLGNFKEFNSCGSGVCKGYVGVAPGSTGTAVSCSEIGGLTTTKTVAGRIWFFNTIGSGKTSVNYSISTGGNGKMCQSSNPNTLCSVTDPNSFNDLDCTCTYSGG